MTLHSAVLQFQDVSGTWMTVSTGVEGNDQYISFRLDELQRRYSGKRVRAVDRNTGRLIDLR